MNAASGSAISREHLADLPIGRHAGEVLLPVSAEEFAIARADLRQERVVGFDTETRPAFRKGESYLPCLAQAATARAVYLLQLGRPQALELVAELLEDARVVKAGIALAGDLRQLRQLVPFQDRNVVDLGIVARRNGYGQTGLRNLAGLFLGIRVPKGAKTSNWAAPQLSAAQIVYAATDAWACREIFLRFESQGLLRRHLNEAPAPVERATDSR